MKTGHELNADFAFDQNILWQATMEALDELPENQREVFIKNEFEGISIREMSEANGISINTLLSRKRAAVLALRERLQDVYDEMD
jgi:DNA-directed RNA polymerase specialized sigma24 family protein